MDTTNQKLIQLKAGTDTMSKHKINTIKKVHTCKQGQELHQWFEQFL